MTFHIGSQTAGVINNAGRDQHISGGQHGTVVELPAARDAVRDLKAALQQAPLDEPTAASAREQVDRLDAELHQDEPERSTVSQTLERLTRLLVAAGPMASAATALGPPLQTLAQWVGTAGAPVLKLLPLLA